MSSGHLGHPHFWLEALDQAPGSHSTSQRGSLSRLGLLSAQLDRLGLGSLSLGLHWGTRRRGVLPTVQKRRWDRTQAWQARELHALVALCRTPACQGWREIQAIGELHRTRCPVPIFGLPGWARQCDKRAGSRGLGLTRALSVSSL
jgi:hypothetical protein